MNEHHACGKCSAEFDELLDLIAHLKEDTCGW
jgi:hypothetical protein